jgi:hypothetical protein
LWKAKQEVGEIKTVAPRRDRTARRIQAGEYEGSARIGIGPVVRRVPPIVAAEPKRVLAERTGPGVTG